MASMGSAVRLPGRVKNGIYAVLDGLATAAWGRRFLTKLSAVSQTAIGAGNHDFAGTRTGENRLLAAVCAVLPHQGALDIGANHGSWGLELLARCPTSRVIFIEPRDRAAREIERRIDGNANAIVIEAAVGDADGEAELYGVDGLGDQASLRIDLLTRTSNLRSNNLDKSERVKLRRVESIAREAIDDKLMSSMADFNIAKVDIEGMEYEVVSQLVADFSEHMTVIQFEFHVYALAQGKTIQDFANLFGSDFVLYRMAPRILIPLAELPSDSANYFGFSNWVAVRQTSAIAIEREYRMANAGMMRKKDWTY